MRSGTPDTCRWKTGQTLPDTALERQMEGSIPEIRRIGDLCKKLELLDRSANGECLRDLDEAGVMPSPAEAVVCVAHHGVDVMRQQDSLVTRSPLEDRRIRGPREADVSDARHVEIWYPTEKTPHDRLIEVLVGEEAKHLWGSAALLLEGAEPLAQLPRLRTGLDLLANLLRAVVLLIQVGVHLGLVAQVVGDGRIDV